MCRGLLSAVAAFTYTDIVFLVPAMLYGLLTARGKKGIVQTDPNLKTTTPKSQPEQVLEEETLEEKVESSRYEGLRRRSSP